LGATSRGCCVLSRRASGFRLVVVSGLQRSAYIGYALKATISSHSKIIRARDEGLVILHPRTGRAEEIVDRKAKIRSCPPTACCLNRRESCRHNYTGILYEMVRTHDFKQLTFGQVGVGIGSCRASIPAVLETTTVTQTTMLQRDFQQKPVASIDSCPVPGRLNVNAELSPTSSSSSSHRSIVSCRNTLH
jgi:hypothetical protein